MADILEVRGLNFRYTDSPRKAVEDFDLRVPEGEIVVH